MYDKFTSIALVLVGVLFQAQLVSGTVTYKGDHYDSAVTTSTTAYSKSVWNYDYSHTLVSGVCKDSELNTLTCSTSTPCGPNCWPVAPDFGGKTNKCAGSSQTPINLEAANIDPTLSPPEFIVTDGGCDKWVQFGDDHAFEVSFSESGMVCTNLKLKYKGTTYTLAQFHFHSPAEHAVANGLGAAELHMVHKSDDGKLLVLGVVMASSGIPAGGGNQFLRKFWDVAYEGYENMYEDTVVAFSALGSTTSGQSTITFASAPSSMPDVGDFLFDSSGSYCFSSGDTVSAVPSTTTITMTGTASATCSTKQFSFVPQCSTYQTLTQTSSTTADSTTITVSATTPLAVGDTLKDDGSGCITTGVTVVSIPTSTTVEISSAALTTCTGKTFGYITSSNLVTAACAAPYSVTAKEVNAMASVGSDVMSGQCKYALEYEAEDQVRPVY